ncbi:hypothetical protein ES703_103268 [subsurface metagenome]
MLGALDHLVLQVYHFHEPLRFRQDFNRSLAPPAHPDALSQLLLLHEQTRFAEVINDCTLALLERQPSIFAGCPAHVPFFIDEFDHG